MLKDFPKTIATYQGHLHSEKQGLQSTRPNKDEEKDTFPPSNSPNLRINDVCYAIVNLQEITTGCMDLTGRFPKRSSRGHEYMLVGKISMRIILE